MALILLKAFFWLRIKKTKRAKRILFKYQFMLRRGKHDTGNIRYTTLRQVEISDRLKTHLSRPKTFSFQMATRHAQTGFQDKRLQTQVQKYLFNVRGTIWGLCIIFVLWKILRKQLTIIIKVQNKMLFKNLLIKNSNMLDTKLGICRFYVRVRSRMGSFSEYVASSRCI